MYIADKYWDNYIGDTDDSLTLAEYLADKHKAKISLKEIFSDLGFNNPNGNFWRDYKPIKAVLNNTDDDKTIVKFYCAIDVIADLAAILLECKINGNVNLCELSGYNLETPTPVICITSTQNEDEIIKNVLTDFVSSPFDYDLSDMCPEEDTLGMAKVCKALIKELYG